MTLQGFARFNVSAGARANETDIGTKVGYVAAGELPQGSFVFPLLGPRPHIFSCVWQVICTQNQVFYIKHLDLNICSSLIPVVGAARTIPLFSYH